MLKKAINLYHKNLFNNYKMLNYLLERGITEESIKHFKVGYATGFYEWCEKHNCLDEAIKYNLVWEYKKEDFMEGFIVFPIIVDGKIKSFAGRRPYATKDKHRFLPYEKTFVYNQDILKDHNNILITEGIFDTITLHQNGFFAVGLLGSHLKDELIPLFKDKNVFILLDNDYAGEIGTNSLIKKLNGTAKNIYPLKFTRKTNMIKEDVNSFFIRSPNAKKIVMEWCKKAQPISEAKFISYTKRIKKGDRRSVAEEDVDIVQVGKKLFNDYIQRGSSLWLYCPFHKGGQENERSLQIGGKKNIFYCYACQAGGGPVVLVSKVKFPFVENYRKKTRMAREWIRKNFNVEES